MPVCAGISAVLLVFVAIGLLVLYRRRDGRPTGRRTTLPCWYDDATLEDIAAQNGVDRKPVEVETQSGHGAGVQLPSVFGRTEGGKRTLHRPYDGPGELISRLVEALDAHGRLHRDANQTKVREGSIQLLEGEWEVEGAEGDLLLRRADDRRAIHVRLDGELTHHGRSAMLGVTRPIHACVIGTVRQHDPVAGCLEIAPIAVFQRG